MNNNEVTSLFKYRPVNEFTLDILANERIYFPKADMFNDPYDTEYFVTDKNETISEKECGEVVDAYPECSGLDSDSIDRVVTDVNGKIKDIITNSGILSLSRDASNLLLWAHYADDHKGVCIEFERNEYNLLGNDGATKQVIYTKSYPSFSKVDFTKNEVFNVVQKILWTKSVDWSYEEEWRVIVSKGGIVNDIPGKIKSITFGLRCSSMSMDIIKKLVEGKNIQLRQAEKLTSEYGINFRNITSIPPVSG